jgi:3',5'-cyclic AMP phosphodiesterase CpdA
VRIAHVSDLHFGRHDTALSSGLAGDIAAQAPDLVVASGDFTQHGTKKEFRAARAFLDALSTPVLAVPGNHDVPARNLMRRFADPYGLYRRYIASDLEPFLEMEGVAIAGIKTSRRMRLELNWAHGSISMEQLTRLERRFDAADANATRVVVVHHPLLRPETPMDVPMRPVDRADLALAAFARMGVRLVLAGHFHLSYVRVHQQAGTAETGEVAGPRQAATAPILVAQTSSTLSTRLRGDANAYNLVDFVEQDIIVAVREWIGGAWTTRERLSAPAGA